MTRSVVVRSAIRATTRPPLLPVTPLITSRLWSSSPSHRNKDDPYHASSSATLGKSGSTHEGSQARTDNTISFEQPRSLPNQPTVQPRSGRHSKRTLPQFSLEGRVAIVTGGARGLGLVMAQSLVMSGANVALVDLNIDEAQRSAKYLVEQYKSSNEDSPQPDDADVPKVTAHKCDVADPESVQSTIDAVIAEHGKIDHLVTSAGFTENFDAIAYPPDRVRKLWGVNVDGTYLFAVGVAKYLMQRKAERGSMVFIGSMSGSIVNVPQPQAPYNASKAAVRHLAASFAVEWAHANIRVNCISPGYMLTALYVPFSLLPLLSHPLCPFPPIPPTLTTY